MTEFLIENNQCGQTLLSLVSRGNAIIAELLRVKDYIPPIFRLQKKADQQKYGDIILDFRYLKSSALYEKKIEDDSTLQELDEQFRENCFEIIRRFYLVFENIHTFVSDLNHFLEELEDGIYIQQTMETVFLDFEGKQLMCEVLYLYGVMLLITDLHIEGVVRERLLVSYLRYSGQRSSSSSSIDDVCILMRSTGFVSNLPGHKRPQNYPENYFSRVNINQTYIDIVIGRLASDDIYGQISTYQLPEHRSTALANQASMLFVCLFFSPNILNNQTTKMREIVDKFFPDNWVITIYMGVTVNLIDAWDSYKAAKNALANTLETINIREYANRFGAKLDRLLPETRNILKEGSLNDDVLIDNFHKIINLARECNVTLRWLMLHTCTACLGFDVNNKKIKQIIDQVCNDSKYDALKVFELLLNTGQFESKIKDMFKRLLSIKDTKWNDCKKESIDRLNELSEVFSGSRPLTRNVEKNSDLEFWFQDIAKQVDSLSNTNARKIAQLIQALEGVQEFHQLETNVQVRQFLAEIRDFLHQMIRTINIKEDLMVTLQIVSDLSYAWNIVENFTPIMQQGIKRDPSLVIKLQATFIKLASALEIPLLRINQAHSADLISVSQYYSNELVLYVKKVLQIIPETMFGIMARIIKLQTDVIKELPTRLEKDKLREFAHFDERFQVAKLTHSISVFTEGILMMDVTLVGVICIEPRRLLEEGIRRELLKHVVQALHNILTFNPKAKGGSELLPKLDQLVETIDGYRRSFEYIQDYVNINGLKIWHEEVSRLISNAADQECIFISQNCFIDGWQNSHNDSQTYIRIPLSLDSQSINFMGCLAREIEKITNPKNNIYVESTSSWYDYKTHKEVVDLKLFSKISKSIGPAGLNGISKMYSFMIVKELQKLNTYLKSISKDKTLTSVIQDVKVEIKNGLNLSKSASNWTALTSKINSTLLEIVLKIGHLQLLRKHISFELGTSSKFDSMDLESAYSALNESLMLDIREHFKNPIEKKYPDEKFLFEFANQLEWLGMYNAFEKVYLFINNIPDMAYVIFVFVLAHLSKCTYSKNIDGLISKKIDQLDGMPLIVGVKTIFKQLETDILEEFIQIALTYFQKSTTICLTTKSIEITPDLITLFNFIEIFTRHAGISRHTLAKYIPEVLLDQFYFLITKSP